MPSSSSSSPYTGFLARISVLLLVIGAGNAATSLSPDFYDSTCPKLDSIVRHKVRKAVQQDPRMGASLLRLHFHDCFVNGCDASVLLDDTPGSPGEKSALPNANSLRGFEVIDDIKTKLEKGCPGVVSCADITALAALYGVVELGGPSWTVALGRRDTTTANITAANNELPSPFLNLNGLIQAFSGKGFTARDLVALSGAHTIGLARCTSFRSRIYNDTDIDPGYAASLRATCPSASGNADGNLSPLDVASPTAFNNDYYKNLMHQLGLLHSDQQLLSSSSTLSLVRKYIDDPASFYDDFAVAMVKMSRLKPLTGTLGQIRKNCRKVNPSGNGITEVIQEQGNVASAY